MSEFLPVKETPEQIQWNIKQHRELVSSVVRSHVTEMAKSLEDLKVSSAQHLKQLKAEHERTRSTPDCISLLAASPGHGESRMNVFRVGQMAAHALTGDQVMVVEVLPVSKRIFYRIEYENGERSLVMDSRLRSVVPTQEKE